MRFLNKFFPGDERYHWQLCCLWLVLSLATALVDGAWWAMTWCLTFFFANLVRYRYEKVLTRAF